MQKMQKMQILQNGADPIAIIELVKPSALFCPPTGQWIAALNCTVLVISHRRYGRTLRSILQQPRWSRKGVG